MVHLASRTALGKVLFPTLIIAALFLSYPTVPDASAEARTITYTSLSTITEGTTNATITLIQFATTTHVTTNVTRTLTSHVATTSVFVDVRYGVTKAPRVVYHYITVTIPRTATVLREVAVETMFVEGTLTTYASPPSERTTTDERVLMMGLSIIALVTAAVLVLAGKKAHIFEPNLPHPMD